MTVKYHESRRNKQLGNFFVVEEDEEELVDIVA